MDPRLPSRMSRDLLNRIDQRTRLADHNRLALLLFRLGGRQLFGVNVFKVQEVLRRPPLFPIPRLPPGFVGAADIRGRSVPILDLGTAVRYPERHLDPPYLVVTEFNRSVQGFLVAEVLLLLPLAILFLISSGSPEERLAIALTAATFYRLGGFLNNAWLAVWFWRKGC